jgi:benzoyl-CoA-dihydrodiol lyase
VDGIAPLSRWNETVTKWARELADSVPVRGKKGVELDPIETPYRYVELTLDPTTRVAELSITAPASATYEQSADWWVLRAFRELDDALLQLRMNHPHIALVLVRAKGSAATVRATDALLAKPQDWFVNEVRQLVKRVLKRVDLSAKSFYAIADEGSVFVGSFLELALACDRIYVLDDPARPIEMGVTELNRGALPMSNGISRLETRFLGTPQKVGEILGGADAAAELATFAPDAIDWDDELRLALEERCSFSPDALTGMESNLRFAGPETMETKIFGRLSAWQNWIFQRPNAVGERGALTCYGTPKRPELNTERT